MVNGTSSMAKRKGQHTENTVEKEASAYKNPADNEDRDIDDEIPDTGRELLRRVINQQAEAGHAAGNKLMGQGHGLDTDGENE